MELLKHTTNSTVNLSQLSDELQKFCQDIYSNGVVMSPNYWDIYSGNELPLYYDTETKNIFVIVVPDKIINVLSVVKQPNNTYTPDKEHPFMGSHYRSSLQLIVNDLENSNVTNTDEGCNQDIESLLRRSKHADNVYNIIKLIRNETVIIGSELFQYGWDKETAINKINDRVSIILKYKGNLEHLTDHDLYHLSTTQMKELGFYPYKLDNDNNHTLYLFPIWLLPALDDKMKVTTIAGTVECIKDCDNDNRAGYLAYGLIRLV